MKKLLIVFFTLMTSLTLYSCGNSRNTTLHGFYQSETIDGYTIQLSAQSEDKTFALYISNREISSGVYEELENNGYALVGNDKTIKIILDKNNSFTLSLNKINDSNPIKIKHIDEVPVYYDSEFDDIEEYKSLLID